MRLNVESVKRFDSQRCGKTRCATGPGKNNWNLSLYKNFKLREKQTVQFRWEQYNALNHASWPGVTTSAQFNPAGQQINSTFGQITGSAPGRIMQGVPWLSF